MIINVPDILAALKQVHLLLKEDIPPPWDRQVLELQLSAPPLPKLVYSTSISTAEPGATFSGEGRR